MKINFLVGIAVIVFSILPNFAQSNKAGASPTPSRVTVTNTLPKPQPSATQKPLATPPSTPIQQLKPSPTPVILGTSTRLIQTNPADYRSMSFAQIKSKIAEAKRQMLVHPITTALTDPVQAVTSLVRIAYYDWRAQQIDYIVISKDAFLTPDVPIIAVSTSGKQIITRTLRANGVNSPVVISDDQGGAQLPLLVQYPVEREHKYYETAYYMSTHPCLVTP